LLPRPERNLPTILPVLAIQIFTPLKRLVLYFLHANFKRNIIQKSSASSMLWTRKATLGDPLSVNLTIWNHNLSTNERERKKDGEGGRSMSTDK
jgi:hypothetical protein